MLGLDEKDSQGIINGTSLLVFKEVKGKELMVDVRVVRGHSSVEQMSNNLLGNAVLQSSSLVSSLPCQETCLFSQSFLSNHVILDVPGENFARNAVCSGTFGDVIILVLKSIQSTYGLGNFRELERGVVPLHHLQGERDS